MKKSIFAVDMVKYLYIIAGCNGAGKTTASKTILPKSLLVKEFVNADIKNNDKFEKISNNE